MGVKGCWTCRERKVRCDSKHPRCGNCAKSQRFCRGYGVQLSWPRDGDRKRAIISHDTVQRSNRDSSSRKLLNMATWDMLLSEEFENGTSTGHFLRSMRIPRPNYLSPTRTSRGESQLLEFFNHSRSTILGPTDEEVLSHFILRTALSGPSDASNTVLQSVFALASLQLHGNSKSFRYKHLVVSAVREPSAWVDERTLLQNLVAMMLLYHYELSLDTNSKGSWVTFFCAVKRIINTSPVSHKLLRREYSVFLDWYFYHEVLAEFSIRHWVRPYQGCGFVPTARSRIIEGNFSMGEQVIGCSTDVLQLIAYGCRQGIIAGPPELKPTSSENEQAKELEQAISGTAEDYATAHQPFLTDRGTTVSDLHRIACLVYINRVNGVLGSNYRHTRLVKEGMTLLTRLETCQNAWPLFVIACEANDDDQRLAVLNVFERSQHHQRQRSNHVHLIQHLVQAVWNQHDLAAEDQIDYLTIFDAVVGGLPFMPVFA